MGLILNLMSLKLSSFPRLIMKSCLLILTLCNLSGETKYYFQFPHPKSTCSTRFFKTWSQDHELQQHSNFLTTLKPLVKPQMLLIHQTLSLPVLLQREWMGSQTPQMQPPLDEYICHKFLWGVGWYSENPQGFSTYIESRFFTQPLPDPLSFYDDIDSVLAGSFQDCGSIKIWWNPSSACKPS